MALTDNDKLIDQALAKAHAGGQDLDALVTVTIDGPADRVACWVTKAAPGSRAKFDHHDARAGDVITIPARDAIRLSVLGFIKEANDRARAQQQAEQGTTDPAAFDAAVEAAVAARVAELDAARDLHVAPPAPTPEPATETPVPDLSALTGSADDTGELRESGLADADLPTGAPELTAHLTQFPDDADRIRAIELARPAGKNGPRVTVLRATGMTDDELAAAGVTS